MYKKKITYTDYDGEKRTEEFLFNLNKAEVLEMQTSKNGGLGFYVKELIKTKDYGKLTQLWKEILFKAYGEKSQDGRRFIKSEELSKAFSETEAYSELFTELALDAKAAAEFINNVIPHDLATDMKDIDLDNPHALIEKINNGE